MHAHFLEGGVNASLSPVVKLPRRLAIPQPTFLSQITNNESRPPWTAILESFSVSI